MVKVINLAVRFILELIILFSLGYWGFSHGSGIILKIILGVGLPLIAAFIWGKTISPKATFNLSLLWTLVIEAVIFTSAIYCLVQLGYQWFAVVFGLIALINRFVIIRWKLQ